MTTMDERRRSNLSGALFELYKKETPTLCYNKFEDDLFDVLSDNTDKAAISRLIKHLRNVGLWQNDPRLAETMAAIRKLTHVQESGSDVISKDVVVDRETFYEVIKANISLLQRAFIQDFVVPDFKQFTNKITEMFYECKITGQGKVASSIPQLERFGSNNFAISLCTIDGQRFSLGDVGVAFPVEAASKPLCYALALRDLGEDYVHKFVGQEPSGESVDQIKLGHNARPHNPMINSGAIAVTSLLNRDECMADRFDYVFNEFRRQAGGDFVGFNNAVFLSERETADRNFAIAHYMNENKCFPEGTVIKDIVEFYLMLCSIEINAESGAVIAATLANGGLCPTTGEQVLDAVSVRNTLTLMHSCGMYEYSGEFAFKVGLPAKANEAGATLLVIPNVAGICVWSPPLDSFGISVRGVEFSKKLVKTFNFHHLDDLRHKSTKLDPRVKDVELEGSHVVHLLFAAANGDTTTLMRMYLAGKSMVPSDYDGRTALHLAAAEGHMHCVKFLVEKCDVNPNPKDRWDHTPTDDARIFGHDDIAIYLQDYIKSQD